MSTTPLRLGTTEWGLICLQSLLWGSAFFFIAVARQELPAFTITALRIIPAIILLLAILLPLGYRLPATWGEWGRFIVFATFNNVFPFTLLIWGQSQFSGGVAAIFNATAPLFGVFLAHMLTPDEKLSLHRLVGIFIGIGGVAILVGPSFAGGSNATLLAVLALLGAPLLYALANIYARVRFGNYQAFVVALMQALGTFPPALLLALLFERPWTLPWPSWSTVGAVVGMGVLGSALASLCHYTVLQRAGANNAMVVTLVMPVTPILLGWAFLGDRFSGWDITGAIVIAAALIMIDGRLPALLRRQLGSAR